jgi:hypothetical protein
MGTEIFVIDADTDTDVSRRLRRLGATVIAVPSLSARDLRRRMTASDQTCGPRALLGRIVGVATCT